MSCLLTHHVNSLSLLLQFLHLRQDYEYNLELLDGRDAELERYDKHFDGIRQELAAKDKISNELRSSLAKAETGQGCTYDIKSFISQFMSHSGNSVALPF